MKTGSFFYTGNFSFPDEDAGARRVYGIGKCLIKLGFNVIYLGVEGAGRAQDARLNGEFSYDKFQYVPSGYSRSGKLRRLKRLFFVHISGISAISRMKSLKKEGNVAVIAYQTTTPALLLLKHFCTKRGIPIIVDAVEWYDRRHVPWGRFGPFAFDSEIRMRYTNLRTDGIMVISSYLEEYYKKQGKLVCRIPPLIDIMEDVWQNQLLYQKHQRPLKLVFIGNAGKKDLVVNAIRGMAMLGHDSKFCRLSIIGPSYKEIFDNLGRDAYLLQNDRLDVEIPGRVSRDEALRRLAYSDYSLVLRPNARFSRAGFPTKLVESLAMGVPVITNLTGDIGMYIHNGVEGIITADSSAGSFADGLRKALDLKPDEREQMRLDARRRALESFDYRNWVSTLGSFINSINPGL
jgi:glycosyltransferase involved in cell wall biosynthesis